jgi:hypothetical protein
MLVIDLGEILNGHEAENGGYSQGLEQIWPILYSARSDSSGHCRCVSEGMK